MKGEARRLITALYGPTERAALKVIGGLTSPEGSLERYRWENSVAIGKRGPRPNATRLRCDPLSGALEATADNRNSVTLILIAGANEREGK